MASIRRTDIMHKSFSKGRPAKTERERNKRRQEAYRWRDARRIYLANSFDKWRKLRSSLGLKDSGLAWHLMEAHEKGQCGICIRSKDSDESDLKPLSHESQVQEFLPTLLSSLRSLCHSHFQFEDCIKIVGLLCLEFDHEKKESFSVNETVSAKLSSSDFSNQSKSCTEILSSLSVSSQNSISTKCQNNTTSNFSADEANMSQDVPIEIALNTFTDANVNRETEGQQSSESNEQCTASSKHITNANCRDMIQPFDCTNGSAMNKRTFRVGVSEEGCEENVYSKSKEDAKQPLPESQIILSLNSQNINHVKREQQNNRPFLSVDSMHQSVSKDESLISSPSIKPTALLKPDPEFETPLNDQPISFNDTAIELPLDMSLIKTESLKNDETLVPLLPSEYDEKQPLSFTCPKMKMKDVHEIQQVESSGHSAGRDDSFSKNRCRHKEESAPSIPWQRRDMSRKEEYEFLEMNPFSDLSEFSLRYPHVHQRTYYRWKRRIKEEYIILEQCPDMTFEYFSSVVLQAKEAVFNLWKGLIAQGRGFFAPSTDVSSKKLDSKSSSSKSLNNFNAEYFYLQKNVSVTQEQFCRKFPNISPDIFNVLQRKVMQEFSLFFQNRQLNWKEFSKILGVSEEVFNCWREHVESMRLSTLSSDMKAALGDFSPNAQMFSPSFSPFLESPSSPADNQLSKDGMRNSVIDQFVSQPMQSDSTLKTSVSRNLSASYLSSLQNMMLPWASYYSLAPPLGQQMLPMMLWPRMLGLASGLPGPMNMSSLVTATSCATSASNLNPSQDVPANGSRGDFPSHIIKDQAKSSEHFLSPKGDITTSKLSRGKRPSSDVAQENNIIYEGDGIKKQRTKEEWDGGNSPYSRSRKQNKQEYVYYLQNPKLCFKDLEALFPTISVRTFYRWRKEMNAAVLFIEDNKGLDYQEFKFVFPDIPEDVFDSWKIKPAKMLASQSALCDNESVYGENKARVEDSDKYTDESSKSENEVCDTAFLRDCSVSGSRESAHTRKICKAAHLFVHQNPDIEFSVFAQMFPNVSVRSFYRWKKEWKDATDFLQTNPEINYETYKSIDASVSKEIFDAWKVNVFSKVKNEEVKDNVAEDGKRDLKANGHCNRKHNGPEFLYLQLNPYCDFSQFTQLYPDVPSRTFYRWKREIQQILNYVRSQPNISFSDISAVLPDVSEEAFLKWKDIIKQGAAASHMADKKEGFSTTPNPIDEEAKNKMTKALLHLMHNPNIGYSDFHQIFDFVSTETFQLWLHRIKLVVLHISSNPNLNYEEFSSAITDIREDVFKKWKSLTPEEISAIGTESQDFNDTLGTPESLSNNDNIKNAIYYCQRHPCISYDVFSFKYPSISKSFFKQWMLKISDQIAFIKDNPGLTFEDFNKVFEDVRETVFESWKLEPFPQYVSSHSVKTEGHETKGLLTGTEERSEKEVRDDYRVESDSPKLELSSSVEKDALCVSETCETLLVSSPAISSTQGPLGNGKENKSQSAESSLSKLTKFAESDVSMYTRWTPGHHPDRDKFLECDEKNSIEHGTLSSHFNTDQLLEKSSCKSHLENDIDNNNIRFNGLYNTGISKLANSSSSNVNKLLNPLSTNISVKELCSPSPELSKSPLKYEHDIDDQSSTGYKLLASDNKSLSALMVMSTNKNQLPLLSSNFKQDIGSGKSSHSASSVSWNSSQMGCKEDDEIFSSQRQKKMSREEYLFVKDHPDVDSQEFARIFPGVSARTFYRWKKEIKAQIQIS